MPKILDDEPKTPRSDLPRVRILFGSVHITTRAYDTRTRFGQANGAAIDVDRIDTPTKLLAFIRNLTEARIIDTDTVSELIEKVSAHFGWNLHGSA